MLNLILWVLKLFFLSLLYLFLIYLMRLILKDLSIFGRVEETLPSAVSDKAAPRLVILEGEDPVGQTFYLGEETLIGRSPQVDLKLKDSFASLKHARIFKKGDEFFLEDLGSTNGTFLGEEKTKGPSALKMGDRLKIGKTLLEFLE